MNNHKFPGLNGDKIFQLYPKSIKLFKEWVGAFPKAGEVFGEEVSLLENSIKALLYYDLRKLYEFFDNQGYVLLIGKIDDHWTFHIEGDAHSHSAESRIEAEERGFAICFELLEKKI